MAECVAMLASLLQAVTIDDIVCVINSGRHKEKSYDPYTNVSTLQAQWISQASERQRRGRAGRCQQVPSPSSGPDVNSQAQGGLRCGARLSSKSSAGYYLASKAASRECL